MNKSLIGLLLFLFTWGVFYASPVSYVSDSQFSLLMDEAILHHRTPNMIEYEVPRGSGIGFQNGYPWNLALINNRLLYIFPWGAPLLSLPAVALLNVTGLEVASKHVYNAAHEIQMQKKLSALLCAVTVWIVYHIATLFLPVGWALGIALGTAFGTPIWSSASRSVWPQTWYLLLISCSIWLLLSHRIRPVLLATLLGWGWFVTQAALPTVILISLYILLALHTNWTRIIYLLTLSFWIALFGSLMWFFTGQMTAPAYTARVLTLHHFFPRLAGILLSPSRGLLVYVPVVFIPLYLAVRHQEDLPTPLLFLVGAVLISIFIECGLRTLWWGGFSYGPRTLIDTVPWFALLAILGFKAFLHDSTITVHERHAVICAAILLSAASVTINAPGALSLAANNWNQAPSVDQHPERVWDWRHPQWLAWAQTR